MSVSPACFRSSWLGRRPFLLPCYDNNGNPKPRKGTRVFRKLGGNYGSDAGRGVGLVVSARNRDGQPESSDLDEDDKLFSQGDRDYLLKLGTGSVAGAALIKYGSVAFPEATKPNLVEALLLISAPVVIAVLLLITLSTRE